MNLILLTAAACLVFGSPAFAMSEIECRTLWNIADTNSDGSLTGTEGDRYLAMMRIANRTASEASLTEIVFQEGCKTDLFKIAAVDPGAPFAGANSFTESQAKDRAIAYGFAMLGTMTKDDKGIWRGAAMVDGKSVAVAVDFKGNVVSQ